MQGGVDGTTSRSRDNYFSCTLIHQLNLEDLTKILDAKNLYPQVSLKCITSLTEGLETMPNSQGIDRVFVYT